MANMNNPNFGETTGGGSRFDSGSMGKNIQEGTTALKDKAQDTMSNITDKASELASNVSDKARAAVDVVSEKAGELASNISDQAKQAACKVTDTWEAGRNYVADQGIQGMASDVGNIVRRYPLPSILLGFCCGFLLARTMRD